MFCSVVCCRVPEKSKTAAFIIISLNKKYDQVCLSRVSCTLRYFYLKKRLYFAISVHLLGLLLNLTDARKLNH